MNKSEFCPTHCLYWWFRWVVTVKQLAHSRELKPTPLQGAGGLPQWSGEGIRPQRRRRGRSHFHAWVGTLPWREKGRPTPVFLPGESRGQGRLAGYRPWGHRAGHDWVTEHTHRDGSTDSNVPHTPALGGPGRRGALSGQGDRARRGRGGGALPSLPDCGAWRTGLRGKRLSLPGGFNIHITGQL